MNATDQGNSRGARVAFTLGPIVSIGLGLASAGCNDEATTYAPDDSPSNGSNAAGRPRANTAPDALAVDVFGTAGNRYYLVVSDEQLELMNQRYSGGGFDPTLGDIYTPGVDDGALTFVDHLLVSTAGENPATADFGKVQVKLVGESSGRAWNASSLPNFKMDSDEFTQGQRIGGVKHMRLNSALVGGIFRENLALDLYRELGYPAPLANYAWVQSSVWGPDVAVPYMVVESYKPAFCSQREAELNGGCANMWEFTGDVGDGLLGLAESCQFSECDASRALEFERVALAAPTGAGFKAALADWLDWDAFHRFQCLSWILATADDALHDPNNTVLMERADGKFQHLPYSVDISFGQEFFPVATLAGNSLIARGCQSEPECWSDLIAVCEDMVAQFIAANPGAMLDRTYALLAKEGMLRAGDEERYHALSDYLARRIEELPVELEENRTSPRIETPCAPPLIGCGDECMLPDECAE